ncbi:MAG: hypothetical protein H0X51_00240 [Parachlamydiaceae bacterium]|nr:hypothetical protein [Parachlamydiaceae bacterium]
MNRKYFYIFLILAALCFFLILAFFEKKPALESSTKALNVPVPFETYIKGIGIVEPKSGNIYIGIPFERIVKQIFVSVNDKVKKDELMIEFDNQDLKANLEVKESEYEKALANLHKLEAYPRKEDLMIAEEVLKQKQVALDAAKTQYEAVLNLSNPRAISKEEQNKRLHNFQTAEAELRQSQAEFEKIKSGAWEPDLNIAKYQVAQSQAEIEAIKTEIERTFIKSPIDGTVLQIQIHKGETPASDVSKTAIILGNVDEYYLRVSIDQFNVSNFSPDAPAVAFRQGNRSTEFLLEFLNIEPLMISKKYLTNSADEKVDTQVFEILYRIQKKDSGLLIGEKMDVFIKKQT